MAGMTPARLTILGFVLLATGCGPALPDPPPRRPDLVSVRALYERSDLYAGRLVQVRVPPGQWVARGDEVWWWHRASGLDRGTDPDVAVAFAVGPDVKAGDELVVQGVAQAGGGKVRVTGAVLVSRRQSPSGGGRGPGP